MIAAFVIGLIEGFHEKFNMNVETCDPMLILNIFLSFFLLYK